MNKRKKKKRKKKKEKRKTQNKRRKKEKVGKASPSWTVTPALRGPRREPACIDGRVGISKPTKSMVFAVFSQTTQYFFQILLFPLEEFLRHLLKKLKLVKSKNFPLKKFRTFFLKKNKKSVFFAKISKISQ